MPSRLAFSGDGLQLFAFGADGEVYLWDSRPYSERQKDRDLVYSQRPQAQDISQHSWTQTFLRIK